MTVEALRLMNPSLPLEEAAHPDFARYGELLSGADVGQVAEYLAAHTPVGEGTKYVASDERAEALPAFFRLARRVFGEMPAQLGFCNGHNDRLNALEYHASCELNIAASDAVLLVALRSEMEGDSIDGSKVRGFLLRRGQAALIHSDTLHFAPCAVDGEGFRVGILLPRGTNTPLERREAGDGPLWMVNKWLLAHPEAAHLMNAGARAGLTGPMIRLRW